MAKKEINIEELIEKKLSENLVTKIKNFRNINLITKMTKRTEIEKFLTNEDIFLIETNLRSQDVSRAALSKYLNISVESMKRMFDLGNNCASNADNIQIISEIIEKCIPDEKNKIDTINTLDTKNYLNKKIVSTPNVTTDILLEKINQLESKLESKLTDLLESMSLKIKEVKEEKEDREDLGDLERKFETFPKDTAVHAFRCNSWIVKELYQIAEKKKWTIKKSINIAMVLFIENYKNDKDEDNNNAEEELTNEL